MAGGWEPVIMLRAFIVNAAFGLGVAVLMRLFSRPRAGSSG
jgi:hypothetical protein